ncbi:MAG: hypothetical protein A3E75_05145 [Planctomycetes bacterium RIFCSPHIGHO2_12_FULL_51_37]|nr:MAG: hypothetical protein A3E75_05145 [Planctomycetes bacterium RIFCSPHIGHO2_12_FULL_51_37]
MEVKKYYIKYDRNLDIASSKIKCACSFVIEPIDPPGNIFSFDISLNRKDFRGLCTQGLLKEDDAQWVLLKYGQEATERELESGTKESISIHIKRGTLPSSPIVSPDDKTKLREFMNGEPRIIKLEKRER